MTDKSTELVGAAGSDSGKSPEPFVLSDKASDLSGDFEGVSFEGGDGSDEGLGESSLTSDEYRFLDSIMTNTFNSVMSIEERVLESRLTAGLTIAEVHTIVAIGLHGMSPMKTVAARLGVSVPTVTNAVNRLVKKGHVERVRDEDDRRLVLLRLTNSGRKACRAHDLFHKHMVVSALEGLTRKEIDILIKALLQIKEFFEREAEVAQA